MSKRRKETLHEYAERVDRGVAERQAARLAEPMTRGMILEIIDWARGDMGDVDSDAYKVIDALRRAFE